jgi:hypothetical protein
MRSSFSAARHGCIEKSLNHLQPNTGDDSYKANFIRHKKYRWNQLVVIQTDTELIGDDTSREIRIIDI